ncbi:ORC complex protein Cdc6/Orc1 [Halomicrobium zhouii]|uniref:ORC1-type DNA replication protein n=1 Tax=Halomicrobium zhouii TaxID=767519 RepID=A0A1I6M484_9EURY|nr:orc1/cdc6 family replication initiation protein [Halomicrobium zhouii]SFS10547.1 ORC complex protein Cdc6/Orc1 [Halomicrobium zhouii]
MNEGSDGGSGGDNLFSDVDAGGGNDVFANRELLNIDHVPDQNRIVGRDDHIRELANEVGPAVTGVPPNSVILYGKTGSGKSLVANHVMERARDEAERRGNRLATVTVDCAQAKGEADTIQTVADSVNRPGTGVKVPTRGISTNEYYNRLWEILDREYDAALITLDEVDRLGDDNVLMLLSRAREAGKVDVPIGIISISNKVNFREQMTERVKSSLGHNEFIFDPYDGEQLRQILENRKDAFQEGVLEPGVIPKTAALAAQRHGDARKAIRLLRHAGDYAKNNGVGEVREDHLELAQEQAEVERLKELIAGLPPHSKYVLYALANLTSKTPDDRDWFRTTVIYDVYRKVCESEGTDDLTTDTVRGLLSELAFLEVTESNQEHGGMGKGTYKEHRLLWEPSVVFKMDPDPARVDVDQ